MEGADGDRAEAEEQGARATAPPTADLSWQRFRACKDPEFDQHGSRMASRLDHFTLFVSDKVQLLHPVRSYRPSSRESEMGAGWRYVAPTPEVVVRTLPLPSCKG